MGLHQEDKGKMATSTSINHDKSSGRLRWSRVMSETKAYYSCAIISFKDACIVFTQLETFPFL